MPEDRAYWLAWSQLPGFGPVLLTRLQQQFGSLAAAWTASPSDLRAIAGVGEKQQAAALKRTEIVPTELLAQHLQKNPHFWTPADSDYPYGLRELPNLPPVLYYCGKPDPRELQGTVPAVGMVGTRSPTDCGKRWTKKVSQVLAKAGFIVISGLAAGIDGEAHRSCLAAGGRTFAVVGTGVDVVYPPQHRQLYDQIGQRGLILSEHPAGVGPNRYHFPSRNRIIAGLSRAVLVMEAPLKSGALITARYAQEFGRPVYVLPNAPDVGEAQGCLRLLQSGAQPIVDLDDLLERLGGKSEKPAEQLPLLSEPTALPPALAPPLAQVFAVVGTTSTAFDAIAQQSGLPPGEVSSALLQLELLGLVAQLPGMRYQRS
ncbi:MAG: DNA-protecting protein DprA [Chloroflexaceae bacterium]|nr:DNA-protecting protein DprA [Chloroflexaceae bacterium]